MDLDCIQTTLRQGLSQMGIDLQAPIAPDDPRLKGRTWDQFVVELVESLQGKPGLAIVLDRLATHVQLSTMKSNFENPRLAGLLDNPSRTVWNITVADFEDVLNELCRQDHLTMDDLADEDIRGMFALFNERAQNTTLDLVASVEKTVPYRKARIRQRLNRLVSSMGYHPDDMVFHLYLHWRELVEDLSECFVQGRFPFTDESVENLIQLMAVAAVDTGDAACIRYKAGLLAHPMGELEEDRALIVERLTGFRPMISRALFELDDKLYKVA